MKFNVNEIWADRDGCLVMIIAIDDRGNYPIRVVDLKDQSFFLTYTSSGHEVGMDLESKHDLVELRGTKVDFPEYFL